jgi:hypothetical protein
MADSVAKVGREWHPRGFASCLPCRTRLGDRGWRHDRGLDNGRWGKVPGDLAGL